MVQTIHRKMKTAVHDMEKKGQRLGTFKKISYFCPQKHRSHDSMRTYYNDVETDGSTRLNLVNLTLKSRIYLFEATPVPARAWTALTIFRLQGNARA